MSATKNATSHAGHHGDFSVLWTKKGWFWIVDEWLTETDSYEIGPFETSQEAFGHRKDTIDLEYIDANH